MYSVVIIDDNKIAVEAISKSTDWEKCGCRVAGTAYDGIAGLELIHDAAPDIVIIDIQMPGFNGLDVIKKIKGARKDVQFIIISGQMASGNPCASRIPNPCLPRSNRCISTGTPCSRSALKKTRLFSTFTAGSSMACSRNVGGVVLSTRSSRE